MTHEYIGTKIVTAWPQEKDGKPGYAVKYADGYTSWSPKDVFEAAYIDIGHVSHLPPHKQRLIGERAELGDKLNKLLAFMAGETFRALPDMERFRLAEQSVAMDHYHKILSARIAAFSEPYMSSDATKAPPSAETAVAPDPIEQEIRAKGLTAPRITPQRIEELMSRIVYTSDVRPNGSTTTLVHAFLDGDFYLATGVSACVSVKNFDAEIGMKIATQNAEAAAKDKLWELEGYALRSRLAAE